MPGQRLLADEGRVAAGARCLLTSALPTVELAPGGKTLERASYREVLLVDRLRRAIRKLTPDIPQAAFEDTCRSA